MHTQQNGGKHMIAEVLFGEIEPWQKNMMSMNQNQDVKFGIAWWIILIRMILRLILTYRCSLSNK